MPRWCELPSTQAQAHAHTQRHCTRPLPAATATTRHEPPTHHQELQAELDGQYAQLLRLLGPPRDERLELGEVDAAVIVGVEALQQHADVVFVDVFHAQHGLPAGKVGV